MDAKQLVPVELIANKIHLIRGHKVMLSPHLAALYQVETRALVQAIKRNAERFPADFMFQLSEKEFADLKSQIVISSWGGSRRAVPYAFTEQGVARSSLSAGIGGEDRGEVACACLYNASANAAGQQGPATRT